MGTIAILVELILMVFTLIQVSRNINNVWFRRLFQAILLVWQVGVLFKIMHWPWANLILIMAPIAAFVIKAASISLQKAKLFDALVLIWLATYSFNYATRTMHTDGYSEIFLAVVGVLDVVLLIILAGWLIYGKVKANNA